MKRELINLQHFAEEPTAGSEKLENVVEGGNDSEVKESAAKTPDSKTKTEGPTAKYTDEDVDRILNQKFAKWKEQQEKAVDEAKKLERMDAQQKAEYERDQLQKELDELKRKATLADMTAVARKMLAAESVNVPDDLVNQLVSADATETKTNIECFAKAFNEAVERTVKERIKGTTPSKGAAPPSAKMTKEEILNIKNPDLRKEKMLENRELFGF